MTKLLTLIFVLLISYKSLMAQSKTSETPVVKGDANACEINAAWFDRLANTLRENDERLFVVARLGKGEVSRDFNRRRLSNVRIYFQNNWKIDEKRMVFAEGEKIREEGRIEFYIGSKLMLVSLVKLGRDICVDCCGSLDLRYYGMTGKTYYGRKKDKPKRRRR